MRPFVYSTFDTVAEPAFLVHHERHLLPETTSLFGLNLLKDSRAAAARRIVDLAAAGRRSTVNFVNAHCVNTMKASRSYRAALKTSDLLLPDGSGIAIAAKMAGETLGENCNGTDLFPLLCQQAASEGVGMFLLGGQPGIAAGAALWARRHAHSLRIAGTADGYFSAEEENALIERINASRAGILLVGMGVPVQEEWIARNRHRIDVPVVMGVGGLFDYYSGRIPRAPQAIRAVGCEWAWRLAMEPRRMAGRYLIGNFAFLARAAFHAANARGATGWLDIRAKRVLDMAGALAAMTMLLPIFLFVALAIRMEDRGPVFFRQTRIGADGTPFSMIKFRSMYTDAEARRQALLAQSDRAGTCFKMREDPRITRVGRIIRRLSIDELPQLFNVLGGSMSLVGPRPALPSEVVAYRGRAWDRLRGKPGITCTWQVRGRAEIPFQRQAIMDRAYLRQRSIVRDIRLLVQTVPAVLSGRGAY